MSTTPTKIEWRTTNGIAVWLDEDGVNVRFGGVSSIEECEVNELLDVIAEAKSVRNSRMSPIPTAPTPEEVRRGSRRWQAQHVARRVAQSVLNELDPSDEVAF